jgi:hypothetical protein
MKTIKNQEKSGENLKNQLLNSGEFSSGEKFKNQESPDQIRRFGNPGVYVKIDKRVQNEAIISLVHGNTNDFREVHPHGYV